MTNLPRKRVDLVAEYNELAKSLGKPEITTKSFNGTNGALTAAIEELRASMSPRRRAMTNADQIAVVDIAREMNLNAKLARAKLRRLYANAENVDLPPTLGERNWVYSREHLPRVRELLLS
jgi:hydroxymethylpyrimidine/phosphomethylpyrimidine kinase